MKLHPAFFVESVKKSMKHFDVLHFCYIFAVLIIINVFRYDMERNAKIGN